MCILGHVEVFDHIDPLFTSLQIMNVYLINTYLCCILMFMYNKGMLPALFNDVFVLSTMTHKCSTRKKLTYKIQFCRTNCSSYLWPILDPKIGTLLF